MRNATQSLILPPAPTSQQPGNRQSTQAQRGRFRNGKARYGRESTKVKPAPPPLPGSTSMSSRASVKSVMPSKFKSPLANVVRSPTRILLTRFSFSQPATKSSMSPCVNEAIVVDVAWHAREKAGRVLVVRGEVERAKIRIRAGQVVVAAAPDEHFQLVEHAAEMVRGADQRAIGVGIGADDQRLSIDGRCRVVVLRWAASATPLTYSTARCGWLLIGHRRHHVRPLVERGGHVRVDVRAAVTQYPVAASRDAHAVLGRVRDNVLLRGRARMGINPQLNAALIDAIVVERAAARSVDRNVIEPSRGRWAEGPGRIR